MGSSGFVNENFNNAEFKDPKIKLNDGSRITGNFLKEMVTLILYQKEFTRHANLN